jgi:hypothetical protein
VLTDGVIVMMFRHEDPPDPLRDFAENQAKKAGLYMPKRSAIDYLDVVPPDVQSGESLDGISFKNGNIGTKYLRVLPGSTTTPLHQVDTAPDVSYQTDTCLNGADTSHV